jgi:hypothetical protein
MAFALSITNLLDAMQQPGCPICRLFRQASRRAVESFLWENVNEPDVRQGIIDSYGFCSPHTRMMAAQELYTSSIALGTNIIYEHLGRITARELEQLRSAGGSSEGMDLGDRLRGWLKNLGLPVKGAKQLQPRGICPVCEVGNNAALNSLHVLCEEIISQNDVREKYLASDGVCLNHMRAAIELHSRRFPGGVRVLIDDTVERLNSQSASMKEYIRKSNWTYRDEKATEAEDTAWRKTLTFFTGLPAAAFTHKEDEF